MIANILVHALQPTGARSSINIMAYFSEQPVEINTFNLDTNQYIDAMFYAYEMFNKRIKQLTPLC